MRRLVWVLVIALFVLHQDVWFWSDDRLVLGVVPIGLAYHIGFSFAAAAVWLLAVRYAWPRHIERWADELDDASGAVAGPSEPPASADATGGRP